MGLGGYLAAKSDADHYITERQREGKKKKKKKEKKKKKRKNDKYIIW